MSVHDLPNRCGCKGDRATWADTSACPIHDSETSPLAQAVTANYEQGRIAALEATVERYAAALRTIRGPEDRGPWIAVYQRAGGGYEGLQAIAREALGDA